METVDHRGRIGPAIGITEAHRAGTAHRAISILVWNASHSRMLIARRSAVKATWPGFWSNAVCSHPLPREPYVAAARRRLFEELRIHERVRPAFRFFYGPVSCPVSGAFEHEMDHVFYAKLAESARLQPNPEEVSALRWVNQSQLDSLKESGNITPWFSMILERVRWTR